ncbi:ubiquitin-conjugating enzyme E2 5 isoform X5 [Jatropha curcas]|uniref:ubiquitin-conjugating enzyme E2 5 isoform X5 n=1 Tax=Jatropha curcas TaxID=180498 RepID=UPI0009D734AF|nr:ubiquitin-conjugating enzyme E2 5 isoform X5 [Jatropha curcas]
MSSQSKRREIDVMKLMMNDYAVELINDRINEIHVEFHGPKESPYEGGIWKIKVALPDAYPYEHPSIVFLNKIFHPNIGLVMYAWMSSSNHGVQCLLLLYPNPSHPMNRDAAFLLTKKDKKQYEEKVKDNYCNRVLQTLCKERKYQRDTLRR